MARFLKSFWDQVQNQRERWIFWLPVPVALGIILYFSLHAEPPFYIGGLALLLTAFGFSTKLPYFYAWLFFFLFILGFTAGQLRTAMVEAPVLEKRTYTMTVEGRVVDVEPLPKSQRIVIDGIQMVQGKLWQNTLPERVRIKLKNNDPANPSAGDIIRVKAILLPLSAPVLPGAFDFQRHAFFKGLGGTGYALGNLEIVSASAPAGGEFFFKKLRAAIRDGIREHVKNPDNAGLITAFMIGEDKSIPEKMWEICRRSGIAHLIAISGSHFVLIAGFTFFLVRALLAALPYVALRYPIKKIAAVAAMAISIFYMLLIGAPIPAQRAVLSVCVVMTAIIIDRDPFTLRVATFAALVVLLIAPESLIGASFQLSFAAIFGLIALYESSATLRAALLRDAPFFRRIGFYLLGCFMMTLVASTATAPFALYHFSQVPLLAGLVANMVAVPVSSFVTFPIGMIACLLMPFGLEEWPLWLMEKSVDLMMVVARDTASWPYAVQQVNAWPAWILGVTALGGLWIVFWRGWIRYLGLVPIVIAIVAASATPRPDVLIADTGKIFAVRGERGELWLSSARVEKFVRNAWMEREGAADIYQVWPEAGEEIEKSPVTCKSNGCLYEAKGKKVLFLSMSVTDDFDCSIADVIVSTEARNGDQLCRGSETIFIDRRDIQREGAHALYFMDNGDIKTETVRQKRGERPWTGKRKLFVRAAGGGRAIP
jgi:competence protein ComEC